MDRNDQYLSKRLPYHSIFLKVRTKCGDRSALVYASFILAVSVSVNAWPATTASPKIKLDTGKEVYEAACVACHGPNGKGMPDTTVGFQKPSSFPDFTRCDQTSPELNVDYKATIRDGGLARGFSPIMPSFGEALNSKQIDEVVQYLRGFCKDKSWPRGEFNLPLPLVTEKAFPEDEVILTSSLNAQGTPGLTNDIIYEQRFGVRNQVEVDAPINFNRSLPGLWYGGLGDATIGIKRVVIANLHTGTILSGFGGMILPSGNTSHAPGNGHHTVRDFRRIRAAAPCPKFCPNAIRYRPANRYDEGPALAVLALRGR